MVSTSVVGVPGGPGSGCLAAVAAPVGNGRATASTVMELPASHTGIGVAVEIGVVTPSAPRSILIFW